MRGIRILVALMGCWVLPVLAASLPPLAMNEAFRTIMIEGEDLAVALDIPLQELSLAAMIDDALEPIPFQFDQYNSAGAPYFEGWEIPLAGKPGVLNPTDKLLFVLKDAGARRPLDIPTDGVPLAEISLRDSQGNTRYVYLLRNARLRSDEQYVRYSSEMGLVETDFYSLRYRNDNHLLWEELQFPFYVGEQPLDAMKLNLSAGLAGPFVTLDFDNDDMVAHPDGAIIGPIRTTTQARFVVSMLGVPLVTLSLQIHHYPRAVIYDVRGVMPRTLRTLSYDPKVSMVLDFNNLMGAEITTAVNPANAALVDGNVSETEQLLRISQFDRTEKSSWIRITTKRNLDTISFLDYAPGFEEPMSLVFEDDADARDAGERFKGHLPSLGYRVEHLPQGGPVGMIASIYFSQSFEGNSAELAQQIRSQPEIQVRPYSDSPVLHSVSQR